VKGTCPGTMMLVASFSFSNLASLDDLTGNKEDLELLTSVYTDVEQADFMIGYLVDK
jgi:hypothetical protein